MKLGIIGDIHLAATPPGRRTETYLADVQAKLDEIAAADDIDGWLLIGDIFHNKRANRVPHWLVAWTWDWISRLAAPVGPSHSDRWVLAVPGNHDLADGSIESLDRQPLGVLGRHPALHIVRGIFNDPGFPEGGYYPQVLPLPGVPLGSNDFTTVPGTGAVCDATLDLGLEQLDCAWVFAHAPIDFQTRPWATYDAATLPLHPNTKGIIYGHQHDAPGIRPRPGGKVVIATGAISRGAISEAHHHPAWVVLDTDLEGTVEVRPIACARPADEVFRWAERSAERAADETIAAFTGALTSEQLDAFSVEGLTEKLRARQDLAPAVIAEAVDILST